MRDELTSIALSNKAGAITAVSSLGTWAASMWGWLDVNITKVSASAAFVLTIVMIVSHMCDTVRKNREGKLRAIEHESAEAERRLRMDLMQRQLNGDKDDV